MDFTTKDVISNLKITNNGSVRVASFDNLLGFRIFRSFDKYEVFKNCRVTTKIVNVCLVFTLSMFNFGLKIHQRATRGNKYFLFTVDFIVVIYC